MAGKQKQTKGRQKIEMKRIENAEDRLITFSKRRSGIYKKASEVSTLCGAEVGVLVFSPAGKPFTFGHPSVETLASRYLAQDPPPSGRPNPLVEAHRKERISELNQQLNQTIARLEAEKQRGKVLKQLRSKQEGKGWWDANLDDLNVQELRQLLSRFENVYQHLCSNVKEKRMSRLGNSSSTSAAANEAGPSAAAAALGYGAIPSSARDPLSSLQVTIAAVLDRHTTTPSRDADSFPPPLAPLVTAPFLQCRCNRTPSSPEENDTTEIGRGPRCYCRGAEH
ncbi:hypothetical protein Tsubulata_018035 [Turnera subulata]|uniref:MADS-box domain-containing protein n=1 Tax=Turnera subulata TaxID=218843 RepID=A0A9Q0J478_9ROSI|nr:hypothetical protein Tsubulata_018035 [Turnera subulata]